MTKKERAISKRMTVHTACYYCGAEYIVLDGYDEYICVTCLRLFGVVPQKG